MAIMFEDLQEGLQQAIDYANGKGQAKTVTYEIEPIIETANRSEQSE